MIMAALAAGITAAGCGSNNGEVEGKPQVEVVDGKYTPEIMHQSCHNQTNYFHILMYYLFKPVTHVIILVNYRTAVLHP